ncbi:MAG: serine/threonine-protein phosphatase [Limnothrix sp. CACIAM 69d]|nr:MAG: serine/threonine-protein phosphatase [Limnothrix sp. CACIAM 69d]
MGSVDRRDPEDSRDTIDRYPLLCLPAMNGLEPPIYCVNPNCAQPRNAIGRERCSECQTPLLYRYLWAVGEVAAAIPVGSMVAGRYYVQAPSVWLETEPARSPDVPPQLPDRSLPYLRLHRWARHVPQFYGLCLMGDQSPDTILLENAPLNDQGQPYPSINEAWGGARNLRRLHWLRQLLDLWPALAAEGVTASLLSLQNVRIQGGRLWLRELMADEADREGNFRRLGDLWFAWLTGWLPQVSTENDALLGVRLQDWCTQIRQGALNAVGAASLLDRLIQETQAQYDLTVAAAGLTDPGRQRSNNEDTCYPDTFSPLPPLGAIDPGVAIVCDGLGGRERGEVASQMAMQSLQLQAQALISEAITSGESIEAPIATEQIRAMLRVANNLIATQNDSQGREARQRMATTAALAIALPQPLRPPFVEQTTIARDLYIAHVGDCRAYWISMGGCIPLTVDDDLAGREAETGFRSYREALNQPNGSAIAQALGAKEADNLQPHVQRWIVDEDGLLLLCSDGFSDRGWVEQSWREYGLGIVTGTRSLNETLKAWVAAAIATNGSDNTTAVALLCRLSPLNVGIPDPWTAAPEAVALAPATWESEMSEASQALLQTTSRPPRSQRRRRSHPGLSKPQWIGLGAIALVILGAIALALTLRPSGDDRPDPNRTPSTPTRPTEPGKPAPSTTTEELPVPGP